MGDLAPPPGAPGIPLGCLLEVFPALHSSFLFLPFSFQQEACVYVWLSLVLSCFVHFLGWLGSCAKWHSTGLSPGSVPSLAFFLSISSSVFSARSMCVCLVVTGFVMFCPFSGLVGQLCQMAFHWALSWKRSQPCILPFYFFQRLFSKKHVFMFCRLLVCGTLRGKWLIYLIEVNA